jgi:hypothetical protein
VLETNREPAIWSVRVDGSDLRPIADGQNPQVMPAATASGTHQELPAARVLQGSGVFPRLVVAAPGADGSTLALYMVEGDRATRVVEFEGLDVGSDSVIVRLSPDGKHVAALLLDSWDGASTLEVVDVAGAVYLALDRDARDLAPGRGAAHEDITGLAWLDDEHILYSKMIPPTAEEADASRVHGEIWLTDLAGAERRRLAEAAVYRVLGASPDGKQAYFSCEPRQEGYLGDGFCVLDVASGALRVLWPRADFPMQGSSASNTAFFGYKLVAMPDGKQRVVFVGTDARVAARSDPPDVWLGDPESGEARIVWMASQGKTFADGSSVYDVPVDFLWSPRSEREFVYLGDGAAFGGVWRVDVESRQADNLMAGNVGLVAWAEEGVVVQSEEAIWLLGEAGEIRGEFRFGGERVLAPVQIPNAVVNWDVPYVHQKWDTPGWWDSAGWWGGNWACGPTSAVMALAYYERLALRAEGYGWYVSTDSCTPGPCGYTHISACEGTNAFTQTRPYKNPPPRI